MEIEARLFNELQRYQQGEKNCFPVELEPGSCVNDLLTKLQIPRTAEHVILVNGKRADKITQLFSGDTVVLFSPVAGG